jgi:GntR family transcriptional repressor for pyruvate dehydrogenase complex
MKAIPAPAAELFVPAAPEAVPRRRPAIALRTPVTQHALDKMQTLIFDGEWAPESRIPSQRELAEQLGVSRSSLREAISSLEGMGLVRVEPGRGVFVSAAGMHAPATRNALVHEIDHTPAEMYEARLLMEGWAAALAAIHISEDDLSTLRALVTQMGRAVKQHDVEQLNQLDFEFHSIIASCCGNRLIRALLAPIFSADEMGAARLSDTAFITHRVKEHKEILAALATRDPHAAQQAMRNHVLRAAKRVQVELPAHVQQLP